MLPVSDMCASCFDISTPKVEDVKKLKVAKIEIRHRVASEISSHEGKHSQLTI